MSDRIWHYCYLMGGISASSAGGIRTNAAVPVCLNLYPQLFLPRRSPPTLPDNPPPPDSGEGGGQRSEMALPSSEKRKGPVLVVIVVVVVAVQGWVRTRAVAAGRAKQQRWRRGVSRQRARRLTDGVTSPFSGQPWIKLLGCLPGCMKNSRAPGFVPAASCEAKHSASRAHSAFQLHDRSFHTSIKEHRNHICSVTCVIPG